MREAKPDQDVAVSRDDGCLVFASVLKPGVDEPAAEFAEWKVDEIGYAHYFAIVACDCECQPVADRDQVAAWCSGSGAPAGDPDRCPFGGDDLSDRPADTRIDLEQERA